PMTTSGLRIGTPALATRGFTTTEFTEVADIIATALQPTIDEETTTALAGRVRALAEKFPLYADL
ncbi:serine hydroxymethyltransferase, partial [Saccharopolyspora sp. 6T]|nr:serine hydroxymethyltransferase [Saccharopolyspora sp. 6T]